MRQGGMCVLTYTCAPVTPWLCPILPHLCFWMVQISSQPWVYPSCPRPGPSWLLMAQVCPRLPTPVACSDDRELPIPHPAPSSASARNNVYPFHQRPPQLIQLLHDSAVSRSPQPPTSPACGALLLPAVCSARAVHTFFATPLLPLPITPSSSRSSSVISLVLAASSVVPCKGQGPQVQAAVH